MSSGSIITAAPPPIAEMSTAVALDRERVSPAAAGSMRRYPALDGLRGVAVLAVVAYHTWPRVAPGGFVGVDVFFVLSGFLITGLLLDEHSAARRVDLIGFYLRRARRLLPAFAVLVAFALAYSAAAGAATASVTRGAIVQSTLYVADIGESAGGDLGILGHTWSLSLEEQFYLLWPGALWLLLRWRGRGAALAVCATWIAAAPVLRLGLWHGGFSSARLYFAPDTRADALLAGCALALAASMGLIDRIPTRLAGGAATVGAALLVGLTLFDPGPNGCMETIGFTLTAAAAAAIVAAASVRPDGRTDSVLAAAPLVHLGRLSYGVYLWHYPFALLLAAALHIVPGAALAALTLPMSVAAARASFILVERRCLAVRTRLPRRVAEPPWVGRRCCPAPPSTVM